MKIFYIAFARIPTEKAHGLTIAKSCESFANAGADVTLIIPKRATKIQGDIFAAYGLKRNFTVKEIAVPDLIGRFGGSVPVFALHYLLFYAAVKMRLLFGSRTTVIYTREALLCMFTWYGYEVVFECHTISKWRGLFFFFARRARRIITISQALKDAFVEAGWSEKRVLVAPSGVDLPVFDISLSKETARDQLSLPPNAYIAVYTGNFTTMGEDKGLSDIIRALQKAKEVLFVAVGGSEKDIARYRTQAEQAGVSDRVVLRGYAPQGTLAAYQKAADVLLMPFPDTPHYRHHMSPVKMFEYMASDRPIIASDLPTIREVLNDKNAFIVQPGDPKALAAAIGELFAEPTAVNRAKNALSTVQSYSWSARARKVLHFIAPC